MSTSWDVIVVGAGNAALCAALAACEQGVRVLVLERAPQAESGGNSRYTAGAFRFTYAGADDIKALVPDLTADEIARTDFDSYSAERHYDDLFAFTRHRSDGVMADQPMVGLPFGRLGQQRAGIRRRRRRLQQVQPLEAYQVGCGISFTFGGIATDGSTGQVVDAARQPIPGLYAAGELVGGLFYFGYPGGSGLMAGSVFGKIAGKHAGRAARG